jgi:hypothetical protein
MDLESCRYQPCLLDQTLVDFRIWKEGAANRYGNEISDVFG